MVSRDVAFTATLVGEKASLTVGGLGTVTVSEAVLELVFPPAGPVRRAFAPSVLVYVPAALAVTLAVTVHEPCAGMLALLKLITPLAAESVAKAPVQVVEAAGELPIVRPEGSVSVNVLWVSAKAFVFLRVRVSIEERVSPTLEGKNDCDTTGGEGVTESAVGQGVEPALDGAVVEALDAVTLISAVSVAPSESVTVSVKVPFPEGR